MSGITDGMQYG